MVDLRVWHVGKAILKRTQGFLQERISNVSASRESTFLQEVVKEIFEGLMDIPQERISERFRKTVRRRHCAAGREDGEILERIMGIPQCASVVFSVCLDLCLFLCTVLIANSVHALFVRGNLCLSIYGSCAHCTPRVLVNLTLAKKKKSKLVGAVFNCLHAEPLVRFRCRLLDAGGVTRVIFLNRPFEPISAESGESVPIIDIVFVHDLACVLLAASPRAVRHALDTMLCVLVELFTPVGCGHLLKAGQDTCHAWVLSCWCCR